MQANELDITNDLYTYQVEYHVMEEDIMDRDDSSENKLSKVEQANKKLKEKNCQLADKLNTQTHKLHNQVMALTYTQCL